MEIPLLTLVVLALAYANGANDVSKGVGTLVGSGLASYRTALKWGTVWTMVGGLLAVWISAGLVRTFSTGLLGAPPDDPGRFLSAVAAGACGWVILASRTGLPVSTTHAMAGAIVGAGMAGSGAAGIRWTLVATTVALPLVASPLVSALLAFLVQRLAGGSLARAAQYCVCLERVQPQFVPVLAAPNASALQDTRPAVPALAVGRLEDCPAERVSGRVRLADTAHWATSAALSLARGLNDTPKIVALGVASWAANGLAGGWLFGAGALAMGLGSYSYGRRVTTTLAERVTEIDPVEGLSASGVAASLVLLASFVALPVSTTHVATGAIVGGGLRGGWRAIRWSVVAGLLLAWVVTIPVAGLMAALAWGLL